MYCIFIMKYLKLYTHIDTRSHEKNKFSKLSLRVAVTHFYFFVALDMYFLAQESSCYYL